VTSVDLGDLSKDGLVSIKAPGGAERIGKKSSSCQTKIGESNGTHTGEALLRPREAWKGPHGPLFPPLRANGNKQLDCPKNPAHLLTRAGRGKEIKTL